MVQGLDMSLDELITKNKPPRKRQTTAFPPPARRRGHHSAAVAAPERRGTRTTPYASTHEYRKLLPLVSDYRHPEPEANLYVSNLHYKVTNRDIQMLFSEVGGLKRCGIHYDDEGRSQGTAEVVFARKSEAIEAIKRFNNLLLDGWPLIIELIGLESMPPLMRPTVTDWQMAPPMPPTVAPWQMTPPMPQAVPPWQISLMPQTVSPCPRPGFVATPNGFSEWHHEGKGRGFVQGWIKQDKRLRKVSTKDLDSDLEEYLSKRKKKTQI